MYLLNLPQDIYQNILDFIDINNIKNIRYVNKEFKDFTNDCNVVKTECIKLSIPKLLELNNNLYKLYLKLLSGNLEILIGSWVRICEICNNLKHYNLKRCITCCSKMDRLDIFYKIVNIKIVNKGNNYIEVLTKNCYRFSCGNDLTIGTHLYRLYNNGEIHYCYNFHLNLNEKDKFHSDYFNDLLFLKYVENENNVFEKWDFNKPKWLSLTQLRNISPKNII
jgi:hypothetical protein